MHKSVLLDALFGAIVGVLWVFPHEPAMSGAHGDSILYVIKNGVWHMVEQGIGGLVVEVLFRNQAAPQCSTAI